MPVDAGVQDEAGSVAGDDWSLRAGGAEPAGYLTPLSARRLQSLSGHEDSFQVDSFNRALQRSTAAGKLSSLFRSKVLSRSSLGAAPGSPSHAGGAGAAGGAMGSPATHGKSPGGASSAGGAAAAAAAAAGGGGGGGLSADDMLQWSNEPIPTSLLRLAPEHAGRATKMFGGILRYCGDGAGGELPSSATAIETAQKLLHQGLKRPELRDELYMQLVKQTRSNPCATSRARAWGLFHLVAAATPASKDFTSLVSEYVHSSLQDMDEGEPAKPAVAATWAALKRSTKCGPRRTLPTVEEIAAHLSGSRLTTIVFFLDETFEEVGYDITTSVAEAVEQLAGLIRLSNFQTFTLYEAVRPLGCRPVGAGAGEALPDEHVLLDDHRYIADVVADLRNPRAAREGCQSRLLFKKRMFRETDEAISEPQFINLSYVQAQHDYLAGHYPVVREDAAQMAALQVHAEFGPGLDAGSDAFASSLERFVTRQVLMTRPRDEWRSDVAARYKALASHSKEEARSGFMRVLRSLPYGNATFFAVRRIEDPIGLLPPRLVLGINKRGLHFFRPVPKEYLHSAELRDIMQFGSSSQAVFFKMRVAGVLHIFQFETRQGEDICMALQTHINDIMMKRYSKVKAASDARQSSDGAPAAPGGGGSAAYSSKVEEHLKEQAAQLEEAQAALAAAQQAEGATRVERDALAGELRDLADQMAGEAAARGALQDELAAAQRQLGELRNELDVARSSLSAATQSVTETSSHAAHQVEELQQLLEAKHRELEDVAARAAAAERAAASAASEREALEKKVARLERARDAEVKELREAAERDAAELRAQLKVRGERLAELMEEAAAAAAALEELRAELEAARADAAEIEELRELKRDVERKEKQQAAIIESQARRLEELDRLYRGEVLARKRAHNALADAAGKIRVIARIRPLLGQELKQGAAPAVTSPSELTVSHAWRDEKAPREYDFDGVHGPGAGQAEVFEGVRHLVRSALDGYNVVLFAYGQTGSGKTHTIYGSGSDPGLAPRGVAELWSLIEGDAGRASYSVRLTMLELYQDTLMDLLLPEPPRRGAGRPSPSLYNNASLGGSSSSSSSAAGSTPPGGGAGGGGEPCKLEIKKDVRGCVSVLGATELAATSGQQLLAAIEQGLARRHTSSTAMNRESSRSHLIISLHLEAVNLQTQATARGKLSFVDLAGSERVKKSGSTGECLKEAASINKSLSALGDVISALAAEQPHIPYRNHKLTMLMSDCLGGNAKTLMFVNVSPAASNLDESQNSLTYAARVRHIKNSARRDEAGKEVLRLRKQVEYWKEQAGLVGAEARAAAELAEIENRRGGGGGDSPRDTPAAVAAAGAALAPVAEASDGGGEAAGGGGSAGEAAGEQE